MLWEENNNNNNNSGWICLAGLTTPLIPFKYMQLLVFPVGCMQSSVAYKNIPNVAWSKQALQH